MRTRGLSEALIEADRERHLAETKPQAIAEVIGRLAPPMVDLETGGISGRVTLPAESVEVKVRYRVRQTGLEAPRKVTIRFNGRLIATAAPLPKNDETAEASVPIPAGAAGELSIFAEHPLAVSDPAVLRIDRSATDQRARRPSLYLLSVGVAHFDSSASGRTLKEGDLVLDDIPNSDRDAERVAAAFSTQKGRLFERVSGATLTNERATAQTVREALQKIATDAGPEDVAIVFFSTHGGVDDKLGFYLATKETEPANPAGTALTGQELSTLLESIKARTILALDTCHAGGALSGARVNKALTSPKDLTGFINGLSSAQQGTVVFSSSDAEEQSLDDPKRGGVFTQAFCEALTGKTSANAGGLVTCATLQTWLNKRVPDLVATLTKGFPNAPQQTPVCVIPKGVPDFAIARP